MSVLSRRSFLRNGSFGVMAVGVVGTVPGLASLLTASATEGPAVDGAATGVVEDSSLASDVMAHVRNLETGEIAVYHGTQEFTFHDPEMAARLFRATR